MNRHDFKPNRLTVGSRTLRQSRVSYSGAKALFVVCILFISLLCCSFSVANPQQSWVVDEVGVLQPDLEERIRRVNENLKPTGAQIAVAAISSLQGEDIETVANETFRDWGVGDKTKNNGVLVLFSLQDRKIRIEVGYGLEDVLPDGLVGRMIRKDIVPAFREKDYSGGVETLLASLVEKISGKYDLENVFEAKVSKGTTRRSGQFSIFPFLLLLIPFLAILKKVLGASLKGNPDRAGIWGQLGYLLYWILTVLFSGGGGGSSGRSSGGFGGGSSGGFGGGSSGGGGASGSW